MFGEYEQRIEKMREDEPNSARVDKAGKMRAKDGSPLYLGVNTFSLFYKMKECYCIFLDG